MTFIDSPAGIGVSLRTLLVLKYSLHKIFSEKPRYFHFSNILDNGPPHLVSKMFEKWKYLGFSEKILCKKYFSQIISKYQSISTSVSYKTVPYKKEPSVIFSTKVFFTQDLFWKTQVLSFFQHFWYQMRGSIFKNVGKMKVPGFFRKDLSFFNISSFFTAVQGICLA